MQFADPSGELWIDPSSDIIDRLRGLTSLFLRLALGLSFLSALADRFGLWGAFGRPNVSWGNFARFVMYTGKLNWFLPENVIPALAIIVTCAEGLLGLCLVIGWRTRTAALLSGILLTLFGVTMAVALGVKAPLDFSVFSAAGGALLLATFTDFPVSAEQLRRGRTSGARNRKIGTESHCRSRKCRLRYLRQIVLPADN